MSSPEVYEIDVTPAGAPLTDQAIEALAALLVDAAMAEVQEESAV